VRRPIVRCPTPSAGVSACQRFGTPSARMTR
jgi:hypothetical protein